MGAPLPLRWACPKCEKTYGTEWGLRIHLDLAHDQATPIQSLNRKAAR
jgi:hypothetical protein